MVELIYNDTPCGVEYFIRDFKEDIQEADLVWHRDYKSRNIYVIAGEGWKLQFDNELPFELKVGDNWFIPSMQFHRLWRGSGTLSLKIREMD